MDKNSDYILIEKAIGYLSLNYKSQPSLEDLSRKLGISPFHFQRLFKKMTGISPKKFLQLITLENTKKILLESQNVLKSTYESGLSSTSRLYDMFESFEAISPNEYKTMGKDLKIYYGFFKTNFGDCLIAVTDRGICDLFFIDSKNNAIKYLENKWPLSKIEYNETITKKYFEAIFKNDKKVRIFVKGTNFQIQVWKALLQIPSGRLVSYKDIAKLINLPKSSRAVGNAVGANPIAYYIPCHRVIKESGAIGNYRWGEYRKKLLLVKEIPFSRRLRSGRDGEEIP